ncbi:MAG: MbtH family NRPS accessory protein [Candidatus Rokuibacteriota bacterium]
MTDAPAPDARWTVAQNVDGAYAIWPSDQACPPGWREMSVRGTRAQCLEFVAQAWTDMRPLGVRSTTALPC